MKPGVWKGAALLGGVSLAASLATFVAVRARASGIPEANALTYTGYLENPDGSPTTGKKGIGISVYDAEVDGNEVCRQKPTDIELTAGRFQLALPEKCTAAVKGGPNLWVEVQVEGSLLGRTKLGVVPYAVEAGHATTADAATTADNAQAATGALKIQLDELASPRTRVDASGIVTPFVLPLNTFVTVPYQKENVDDLSEFSSGVFTPKEAGDYSVCAALLTAPGVFFELSIFLDNSRSWSLGRGNYAGSMCRTIRLAAGVKLDVRVYSESAIANVPTNGVWDWITISRVR